MFIISLYKLKHVSELPASEPCWMVWSIFRDDGVKLGSGIGSYQGLQADDRTFFNLVGLGSVALVRIRIWQGDKPAFLCFCLVLEKKRAYFQEMDVGASLYIELLLRRRKKVNVTVEGSLKKYLGSAQTYHSTWR
ncbi:hypothetical protein TEQG_06173 [Trichophyton equinum CBS 127.97]|uniref:Uncharacterized protein n=1 Tax=Trichophyton equinum (strain ATCC MYA-4606 / CBS 127.97) TaxID=559882 RepID=F2PZ68_TRIEC|nr:hypothetical protein TEQG_06173 [Trichophyton equinum CBS 127.97]